MTDWCLLCVHKFPTRMPKLPFLGPLSSWLCSEQTGEQSWIHTPLPHMWSKAWIIFTSQHQSSRTSTPIRSACNDPRVRHWFHRLPQWHPWPGNLQVVLDWKNEEAVYGHEAENSLHITKRRYSHRSKTSMRLFAVSIQKSRSPVARKCWIFGTLSKGFGVSSVLFKHTSIAKTASQNISKTPSKHFLKPLNIRAYDQTLSFWNFNQPMDPTWPHCAQGQCSSIASWPALGPSPSAAQPPPRQPARRLLAGEVIWWRVVLQWLVVNQRGASAGVNKKKTKRDNLVWRRCKANEPAAAACAVGLGISASRSLESAARKSLIPGLSKPNLSWFSFPFLDSCHQEFPALRWRWPLAQVVQQPLCLGWNKWPPAFPKSAKQEKQPVEENHPTRFRSYCVCKNSCWYPQSKGSWKAVL